MVTYYDIAILIVAGGIAGFLSGLLGVGGGVVYVAILTHYLEKMHLNSVELVRFILSNSFFAILFSSLMGSYQQIKMKNFFLKEVLSTGITAVISWLAISFLILKFNWYSKHIFSIFFIIVLFGVALRMFLTTRTRNNSDYKDALPIKVYPFIGFLTGMFAAFSGLGGGVITVPILSDYLKLRIKKATSISLGLIPLLALTSTIFYSFGIPQSDIHSTIGYLKADLVIPMVIGGMIAAPFGVKYSSRLSEKAVRIWFVMILLVVATRMSITLF